MGYENALATKVLATHCCACGRPLVDAVSVEFGMGPDCRKKYFVVDGVSETNRKEANVIVAALAQIVSFGNPTEDIKFAVGVAQLNWLGFDKLAQKITSKMIQIKITAVGDYLAVATPYNENAVPAFQAIKGRWFDKATKTNRIPVSQRAALWDVLKTFYNGKAGIGPKGAFQVK